MLLLVLKALFANSYESLELNSLQVLSVKTAMLPTVALARGWKSRLPSQLISVVYYSDVTVACAVLRQNHSQQNNPTGCFLPPVASYLEALCDSPTVVCSHLILGAASMAVSSFISLGQVRLLLQGHASGGNIGMVMTLDHITGRVPNTKVYWALLALQHLRVCANRAR